MVPAGSGTWGTSGYPALSSRSLSDLHLAGANPEYDDLDWRTRRRSSLARVWADAAVGTPEALLARGVTSAINVSTTLEAFTGDDPHNGATYPTTWPGAAGSSCRTRLSPS